MFNAFRNVLGYVGLIRRDPDEFSDDDLEGPTDAHFNEILAQAEACEDLDLDEVVNQIPVLPVVPVLSTVHRNGKITKLNEADGVIDSKYFFDRRNAPHEGLDVGKTVSYHAYRESDAAEWTVSKIIAVHEENWDDDDDALPQTEAFQAEVEEEEDTIVKSGAANERTITGRVECRNGRIVTVRDSVQLKSSGCRLRDTLFDLNKVRSNFTPIEGDIVSMNAYVEISEETVDLSGDVIKVQTISPNRVRTEEGCVVRYNRNLGHGVLRTDSGEVYFEKDVCDPGYVPRSKDLVKVTVMECDKRPFEWRAINVLTSDRSHQREGRVERSPKKTYHAMDPDLMRNKGDINVQENTDYGLFPNTKEGTKRYEITVAVTNNGNASKTIKSHSISTRPSNLTLLEPRDPRVTVRAMETVTFRFDFKKDYLGCFSEAFIIDFHEFQIGRLLKWEVFSPDMQFSPLPPENTKTDKFYIQNRQQMAQQYLQVQESGKFKIQGERPFKKGPSFVKNRIGIHKVPVSIEMAMTSGGDITKEDAKDALLECCPELKEKLSASNHNRRFHHLLHIAEVDSQIDLCRYDMERVSFIRRGPSGEYLALEIEGLAEGRPSLLTGDAIEVNSSWMDKNETTLVGYVHKVLQKEAWFKFHLSFHSTYAGEDYNVHFVAARGSFRKCHSALDICSSNHGNVWLFPQIVQAKQPQVQVVWEDDIDYILPSLEDESHDDEADANQNGNTTDGDCSVQNFFESFKSSPPKSESSILKEFVLVGDIESSLHKADCSQNGYYSRSTSKKTDQTSPKTKLATFNHLAKKSTWCNKRLNKRQKEAVKNILLGEARPLPYIIFGPPGTGKTMTLVEAILQVYLLRADSRILIATPSNSSANLLAERLLDSGFLQPGDMTRLVAHYLVVENKVPEKLIPYSATIDTSSSSPDSIPVPDERGVLSLNNKMIMRRRILIGTCVALGQVMCLDLPRGHYSHIFIDEAGQATEPEIIIPLSFMAHESGQAVLAGDPHQLGPVVQSNLAASLGLSTSLLARLLPRFPYQRDARGFPNSGGYDPRLVTRLTVNYRSLPDILELPSSMFYDSDLEPSISDEDSFEAQVLQRLTSQEHLNLPHSAVVFHAAKGDTCRDDDSPSYYNRVEIVEVCMYMAKLLAAGVDCDDIGIITPYQKQVFHIRKMLERLQHPYPKIGSVEEFQGQERLVIILSTVRSSGKNYVDYEQRNAARKLLGFVNNKERLNVAISRARALLLIIGDPEVLCVDPYWRNVVKYCVDRNAYVGGVGIPKQLLED